jgi:phage replication O-like protein O
MAESKRKKVTREPHTQLFNEVLEGIAYAKLKPTEWQFIMVLWRLTYGRKNMTHKESGKFTTWINAEFHRRTGLERTKVSKIKNDLLAKKVIVQKKGMIGFNKHFDKWKKGMVYTNPIGSKQTMVHTDHKVWSKQTTTVGHTDHKDRPKVQSSAEVQRLKKERKKEILSHDRDFESFWLKYPRKREKHNARKVWTKYYADGAFTLGQITELLHNYINGEWEGREMRYIPHAASWLNKRPWEDQESTRSGLNYREEAELIQLYNDLRWFKQQVGLEDVDQEALKRKLDAIELGIKTLKAKKENA